MRLLHTMIRVSNLDKSIEFYTKALGMKLLSQKDYPDGKFTLAFLGYGESKDNTVLELTYNWDTNSYDHGNAFGHIAIGVDDVYKAADKINALGYEITRKPGPMKHGSTVLAFAKDPDGYQIELLND